MRPLPRPSAKIQMEKADETGVETCQGTRVGFWVAGVPGAEVFLVLPGRGHSQAVAEDFDRFQHPFERVDRKTQCRRSHSMVSTMQMLIEAKGKNSLFSGKSQNSKISESRSRM